MGYTHYWNLKVKGNQKNFNAAKKDISKLIKNQVVILANGMGEEGSKPEAGKEVNFNGIEDESYETFSLPEKMPTNDDDCFNFCKTAQKEYDFVVTASLIVLKHYLKNDVKVSSDGDKEDWTEGLALAEKVLDTSFKIPIE